ncbi:MAG TPA: hypothetical protein VGU45_17230 [Microvirga sp.]|jgi:hypothetical protein|nr:hypothetical protein [Microvirga sp.]
MMVRSALPSSEMPVAILFPPTMLPVIDIFRALGDFEEHYEIGALDLLESRLSSLMGRDLAKGIVSDALLLAFGLRRERREPLDYRPVQSRRGTADEYRLMALMAATYWHDFHLAAAAAAALDVRHPQPLISLAFDIARRLEAAGLRLEAPDPRLFTSPDERNAVEVEDERRPDRRIHRDA